MYDDVEDGRLGAGASGVVVLVRHRKTAETFALKTIHASSTADARRALQEAQRMFALRHPTLVLAHGAHAARLPRDRWDCCILMEYCQGGDVSALLRAQHPLGEERSLQLLAQLVCALEFLHGSGVVHRDIKPANLLLSADGRTLKLADLGLARAVDVTQSTRAGVGTLAYMAPEIFEGAPAATTMDIWSLGIVAAELSMGRCPAIVGPAAAATLATALEQLPSSYSRAYREAVASMCAQEPAGRPSACELVHRALLHGHVQSFHERASVHASPSILALQQLVDSAPWLTPARTSGLCWQQLSPASPSSDVRLCDCRPEHPAEQLAARRLAELVHAGCARFAVEYAVERAVLCFSRARASMHVAKALDLGAKLEGGLLSLQREIASSADASVVAARRQVLQRVMAQPSAHPDVGGGVRCWLAFSAAPNEEVARSICRGNYAVLGRRDAGFYGQGIYLSLDAKYCLDVYGNTDDAHAATPLLVCAVVVGSAFPVVEMPLSRDGWLGKPIVAKADSHVCVVGWGHGQAPRSPFWLPCAPERWAHQPTYTELVVRDESQILPLGYVMVTRSAQHVPHRHAADSADGRATDGRASRAAVLARPIDGSVAAVPPSPRGAKALNSAETPSADSPASILPAVTEHFEAMPAGSADDGDDGDDGDGERDTHAPLRVLAPPEVETDGVDAEQLARAPLSVRTPRTPNDFLLLDLVNSCRAPAYKAEVARRGKAVLHADRSGGGATCALVLGKMQMPTLPESLGRWAHVTSLDVQRNLLETLPESLGSMHALQVLILTFNRLVELPHSLGQLARLRELYAGHNRLKALPCSLCELHALETLDCDGNAALARPPLSVVHEGVGAVQAYLRDRDGERDARGGSLRQGDALGRRATEAEMHAALAAVREQE